MSPFCGLSSNGSIFRPAGLKSGFQLLQLVVVLLLELVLSLLGASRSTFAFDCWPVSVAIERMAGSSERRRPGRFLPMHGHDVVDDHPQHRAESRRRTANAAC